MKMNKTQIAILMLVVLLIGIFAWKGKNKNRSEDSQKKVIQTDSLTTVKLSALPNSNYSPQLVKVKLGTKVRIEGNPKTLSGGMDTVIVDGYNVSKKISVDDNVLEFEANNPGQYKIHCANNMGNGMLIVE